MAEQATSEQCYFTREQFARRLGVHSRTLRRWEQRGVLRPLRVGGRLFYADRLLEQADLHHRATRMVEALREGTNR